MSLGGPTLVFSSARPVLLVLLQALVHKAIGMASQWSQWDFDLVSITRCYKQQGKLHG